ncbi:ku70-like protein [Hymenopellis radicata]|nr:ku70-like protein [Hymenopellis radicata]
MSYDEWNKVEDEDDEELQDTSFMETKKDVILFCIDCSPSMQAMFDDPVYEDVQTSNLYMALDAAMQIQKKKVVVGPNDSIGILLFNTTKTPDRKDLQGSEIKRNTYLFQPISPLNAQTIQELIHLLEEPRETLCQTFPPVEGQRVPMGDVFTSCNWVLRDGAPKTATKRVFLITDEDQPHTASQLITSAKTTLTDLTQAGVTVEPFFISTEDKPFDKNKFYSSVLLSNMAEDEDEEGLPESISISRIEDLLAQMRFHEVPKRALFSVPFKLAEGFTIGVKGYGLVTEQKKGAYKYFTDLGDRMEVADSKTLYVDPERETEVDKKSILYGMHVKTVKPATEDGEGSEEISGRIVKPGDRPLYTAEEIRSFRTLGLEPGLKLLGFKDRSELAFEDNIKHAQFIHPDEMTYSGSKRTFNALLKSLVKKKKIGLILAVMRRNSAPTFCALLPQEEKADEGGWTEPAGFHLIPLPFADDIRAAPIDKGFTASDDLKDAAYKFINKLCLKSGGYPPDSYPNPVLAFHNAQLQASAFHEEYDPDSFKDETLPNNDLIHKRAGALMAEWKKLVQDDPSHDLVMPTKSRSTATKRAAETSIDEAEIRSRYDSGTLDKLLVATLKEFLKSKAQPVSGKKADLVERVSDWLNEH